MAAACRGRAVAGREGETWGDRLEQMLGADRVAVINHGVPGYSTAEHVSQTAFYEHTHGVPPRCSIYYIGWNDLWNSHVRNLDPGYAGAGCGCGVPMSDQALRQS